MNQGIDALTERFQTALSVMMQNLGPQLINRAHLDLTPGQVIMMYFIRQQNPCSVSKLAEKMEVAPSAITVMLDRLENHGFAVRTRNKTDRRVVIVELTGSGEEKLNHVLNMRKQIMQHCLTQIKLNELNSFVQTLEKLASVAQAMDIKAIID